MSEPQVYVVPRFTELEGRELWQAMLEEVKRERLHLPATAVVLIRIGVLVALLAAALGLSWFGGSWSVVAAGYVLAALVMAQFAFIGHDAGHGGISGRAWLNRALGELGQTVVTGIAFDEWKGRHRSHHQYCQEEERDPDMAVDVVVSLTERSGRTKSAFGRLLTRHQAVHVWLLSLFFGHSQRHLSQAAVFRSPSRYRLDLACLVLHVALWFVLPCAVLGIPVRIAILAWFVPVTILGPYLAAIFWVNHIGMPLVRRADEFSFLEHQVVTSRTVVTPRWWNWFFGGLNFQIEHHLFPQVPSSRLPALSVIVRKHLAGRGIAYQGVSWWGALRAVAGHLRAVGRAA